MNQSIVIGRLVRDVELKFTPGQGKAIATGTVAVNRRIPKDKTDFINVQQWGAPAEKYFAQYGHKGRLVAVRGELNIDKWKDRDGNWKERSYIVASEIKFLDKFSEYSDADTEGFTTMDLDDPDIPF